MFKQILTALLIGEWYKIIVHSVKFTIGLVDGVGHLYLKLDIILIKKIKKKKKKKITLLGLFF